MPAVRAASWHASTMISTAWSRPPIDLGELFSQCVDQGSNRFAKPEHPSHAEPTRSGSDTATGSTPPPAVSTFVDHLDGCLQREARLATAPGAGECHKAILFKRGAQLEELMCPAREARELMRTVVRDRIEGPHRVHGCHAPVRTPQVVQPLWCQGCGTPSALNLVGAVRRRERYSVADGEVSRILAGIGAAVPLAGSLNGTRVDRSARVSMCWR